MPTAEFKLESTVNNLVFAKVIISQLAERGRATLTVKTQPAARFWQKFKFICFVLIGRADVITANQREAAQKRKL